ncbi:MAG TPA: hypothetical protein DF984_06460 [Anaerolineaceae bacterium]|nr:hypothetical protein [Anaerolineaceae bacterium]
MPEITGIHYRWYQGGLSQSSPIIFIHGACMDSRSWPTSLRTFGDRPVIMLDLPGHGQSQSVCKHSIYAYSLSLAAFIDQLDLKLPFLVGVGIGGSIIMEYIARHLDRVGGFLAVNTSQSYFVPTKALSAIQANQYFPAAEEMLRQGMHPLKNHRVWEEVNAIAKSQRDSVLAADLRLMHHYRCSPTLDSIASVPGLFLYGTGDRLLREIPTNLPGKLSARLIPGGGHWLPLENPELIRNEILSFLEIVSSTSIED